MRCSVRYHRNFSWEQQELGDTASAEGEPITGI